MLEEERGGGRKGGEEDAHLVSLWRMKANEVSSKTKDEGFKASSSHLKANESSFKDFLIGVDARARVEGSSFRAQALSVGAKTEGSMVGVVFTRWRPSADVIRL